MKVWCMYNVYDMATNKSLVIGFKQKDFDNGNIRYIMEGTSRCFPLFWRKHTDYFRTVTINGRDCYIMYWALNWTAKPCNIVTLEGIKHNLNGRFYEKDKL